MLHNTYIQSSQCIYTLPTTYTCYPMYMLPNAYDTQRIYVMHPTHILDAQRICDHIHMLPNSYTCYPTHIYVTQRICYPTHILATQRICYPIHMLPNTYTCYPMHMLPNTYVTQHIWFTPNTYVPQRICHPPYINMSPNAYDWHPTHMTWSPKYLCEPNAYMLICIGYLFPNAYHMRWGTLRLLPNAYPHLTQRISSTYINRYMRWGYALESVSICGGAHMRWGTPPEPPTCWCFKVHSDSVLWHMSAPTLIFLHLYTCMHTLYIYTCLSIVFFMQYASVHVVDQTAWHSTCLYQCSSSRNPLTSLVTITICLWCLVCNKIYMYCCIYILT